MRRVVFLLCAVWGIATLLAACAVQNLPPVRVTLVATGETLAYTAPCGCCSAQSGGLSRRATYLYELSQELRKKVAENTVVTAVEEEQGATNPQKAGEQSSNEKPAEDLSESTDSPAPVVAEEFLLFDTGNFTDATTEDKLIQSRYVAEAMEMMYYDAVNLGKRELGLPQERLVELLRPLKNTPVVCANVKFVRPRVAALQVKSKIPPEMVSAFCQYLL